MKVDLGEKHVAVERAVDVAYPMFQMFGWEWRGKVVKRDEMVASLHEHIDHLIKMDGGTISSSSGSGRFTCAIGDGQIEIYLDLGQIWIEETTKDGRK